MTLPCIPTLHKGYGILTDPSDIVAYLVRHIFAQSSKASIIYGTEIVSFRDIESRYNGNIDEMVSYLNSCLYDVLNRYFSPGTMGISVSATTPDASGTYNLEISATKNPGSTAEKLILTDAIVSIKNGSVLNIVFKGAKI